MSGSNNKLKINVFGELWTLKKVNLNPVELEYYTNIASSIKKPLHQALLDPFFYPKLRLENTQSFFDLRGNKISGITENQTNQIDLWYNGSKEKIWIKSLKNNTLFPIYKVRFSEIGKPSEPGIYIETLEFGKIGSCELLIQNLDTTNLEFEFIKYENMLLLKNEFFYDSMPFKVLKTDCNFTRIYSYEI